MYGAKIGIIFIQSTYKFILKIFNLIQYTTILLHKTPQIKALGLYNLILSHFTQGTYPIYTAFFTTTIKVYSIVTNCQINTNQLLHHNSHIYLYIRNILKYGNLYCFLFLIPNRLTNYPNKHKSTLTS